MRIEDTLLIVGYLSIMLVILLTHLMGAVLDDEDCEKLACSLWYFWNLLGMVLISYFVITSPFHLFDMYV
jgi:hypothetical protein